LKLYGQKFKFSCLAKGLGVTHEVVITGMQASSNPAALSLLHCDFSNRQIFSDRDLEYDLALIN
jgi:hypothetical protein